MTSELKPCPFCGEVPKTQDIENCSIGFFCLMCRCGKAMTLWHETKCDVIEEWNTRVKPKPTHIDAPFAIGDIIEPIVGNPYNSEFEVVGETATTMDLKNVKGMLEGLTIKRNKKTLARDWRLVER